MWKLRRGRAVSPLLATLVLIAITVSACLFVYAQFSGTLRRQHARVEVQVVDLELYKFGDKALELWRKFRNLFSPMDELIDFYLFQLPPFMTPKYASRIERFIEKVRLDERFALEVRNVEWFNERWFRWASCYGITWVSIDSPDLPREILSTNGKVYVRMHGRTSWYNHVYTDEELSDVLLRILLIKPRKVYIFFNNDHGMLVNARRALELYRKINDQQMKRE